MRLRPAAIVGLERPLALHECCYRAAVLPLNGSVFQRDRDSLPTVTTALDGLVSVTRANPNRSRHQWRRQSLCLVLQSPIPEDRWQKDTCPTRHLGFPPKISTNCGKGCGNRPRSMLFHWLTSRNTFFLKHS
jgi:hypothetical protein